MELDRVIKERKSVRSFKHKKASWKEVLEAIDAAIQAPFAGNHNHLKFLIVEEEKTIIQLAGLANQLWISEARIIVLVLSDDTHLESQYGERGRVYSRQGAGAAIENFLLKITDLGLSACWVGAYKDHDLRILLKIPNHVQIEAMIPVGYEKEKLKRQQKQELENVLYWEEWDKKKRPSPIHESKDPYSIR